ncbi:MAG TPA: lytic transglycosylase domain-containing protein [Bryobacterales bacterium]|nr:lytic transglycosylase domain-containing protein [Bryobacterales bacterium]
MILFGKIWMAGLGLVLLVTPVVEAEPMSDGSSLIRRYDVREDAETGRLTRVKSLVRRSARTGGSAGNEVAGSVQGRQTGLGHVDVDSLVQDAGRRHSVDPNLIHAVIRQESNYDVFAVSVKGACGLMQLMPGTALRFGVRDIFDPAENVEGGVKYLRFLMDRYQDDDVKTLAAYNAGEGAVDQYGGVPPYRETVDYVDRVSQSYRSVGVVSDEVPAGPRVSSYVDAAGALVIEMR